MKNLTLIALLCHATSAYSQIEISDTAIDATLTLGRQGADCRDRGA
ncbi:MAG: hypothetical protein ACJAT0_001854 [Nonlabens sp.]|jgi:hypothetical protein